MSRATGAVTTTSNPIHLTLQIGPSGTALVVSNTPSPFPNHTITMTRAEFRIFRLFMLHILGLNSGTPHLGIGKISPVHDTTLEILYFLYADIARLVAPQLNPQEQLECTAIALCVGAPARNYSTRPAVCLFDFSVDLKVGSLMNAALNANLEELKNIINKTHPAKLDELLRAEYAAIIAHCGIERTGTALQMALYSGDEKMVGVIKQYMDQYMDLAEFQRQWIEVFGSNYNAFLKRQKIQAVALCAELRTGFNPESVNRFQQTLTRYVRANPVHNPFVLQTLFEIYDQVSFDFNMLQQFSQLAIGHAEKLSSAAWLQHLAQGIYQIMGQNEPLGRSFLLRRTPHLDIRSLDGLGVNCCIDIFDGGVDQPNWCSYVLGITITLSKLLSSKNIELGKLIQSAAERQCVIQ